MSTNNPDKGSPPVAHPTSQTRQLTRSGARRQGDEYQDIQALDLLVRWLEHSDRYQWVQLEATDSGFLDDILVLRADGVLEAWQVKFSTQAHAQDDAWTWEALLAQKMKRGAELSLLQKWFRTWQDFVARGTHVAPQLISNRRAAAELALDGSRDGKVCWDALTDDTRQKILEQLVDEALAQAFFETFHFRLGEPSLRELEEGAYTRFLRLGGTPGGWHAINKAVREWVNTKDNPSPDGRIFLDEVRRIAKLKVHPVRLHTFIPPLVFFGRYMEQGRIFHHRLPQVGRRSELKELLNFVGGKNQVAILPGRGGSGKSKLLHTFCRRLERWYPDLSVRLVAENLPIKETTLEELPDDQCLIIIDDAHRTNGIEVILAAAQQNPRLKVLLVTRPHATEYLTVQASKAGFDHNDIIVYKPLTELNYARQHRRLARLVLGPDWDHYADDLAGATRDSPLLTILGGELLRSKQISPAFLSQDNTFRQEILARFRDIRLGEIIAQLDSRFTQQVCAEVLQLIAVLTPFDLDHADLVQAVAQLAGIDEVKLKQLVGILVEAGALVRGGRLVRIVPDVLSDFILHEACFTRDGVSTGWANKVYQAVSEFGFDLVLRNLSELDWRVRTAPASQDRPGSALIDSETGLLDAIWRDIEDRFRGSSLKERKAWFNRLEHIASMQPHRLWPLVEMVQNEPVAEDPDEIGPVLKLWLRPTTQADVMAALVPILRGIAYDDRFTMRCADLLWEMGRDVEPKPGSSPSPIGVLRELASYKPYKPFSFSHIVLDCCRKWINNPDIPRYRHFILEVLSPMLARTADWTNLDGRWLSYGSFTLSPEPLRELRNGALALVKQCALSGVRQIVLHALDTLHTPISEEDLWKLEEEDPSMWQAWEEEQLAALEIVARVAQTNDDPFVRLKICEELHWQAKRGPRPAVQSRAREILEAIPLSFESRLILLITDRHGLEQYRKTWVDLEEDDDDWLKVDHQTRFLIEQKRRQRRAAFARQVISEWVNNYPDPGEGFHAFDKWIENIETSNWWKSLWTRSNPFMLQLAADHPSYARNWCEIALEKPEARTTGMCDDLLSELRHQDARAALELVQRFLAHDHPNLWLRVAGSYSWRGWPSDPLPEEWQIVEKLLAFPYPQVKRSAAKIVAVIASTYPERALKFVLDTEVGEDTELAETLFQMFEEHRGFDITRMAPDDLRHLLDKLKMVESVRGYQLGRFLLQAALHDPIVVAQLLLDRVQHKIKLNKERIETPIDDRSRAKQLLDDFRGLPHAGFHDEEFQQVAIHPDYPNALRLIRDAALREEDHSTLPWEDNLSELFRDFSLNYGPTSLAILDEWINSGDCVRVRMAMHLLRDTYLGFYVKNLSFVSNYLHRAEDCGKEILEEVERAMFHCAVYGPPRAIASFHGERSRALLDQAGKALENVQGDRLISGFFLQLHNKGKAMLRDEQQREEEEEIFFRS